MLVQQVRRGSLSRACILRIRLIFLWPSLAVYQVFRLVLTGWFPSSSWGDFGRLEGALDLVSLPPVACVVGAPRLDGSRDGVARDTHTSIVIFIEDSPILAWVARGRDFWDGGASVWVLG